MNRRPLPATIALLFFLAAFAGAAVAYAQPPAAKPPAPAPKPGAPKPAPPQPPSAEPAPPAPPPFTPIETPSEIADRYHKEAMQAAAAKDWRTAAKLLHKAWELKQTYDIAANLGSMAYELKDFGEAAELLDWARANTPTGTPPDEVAAIEKKLGLAQAEVATVRINTNVDGCAIAVDTKVRDKRLVAVPVYLAPGRHGFECAAAGYEPAREERVVDKGTQIVVTLTLRKAGDHDEPRGGDTPNKRYWPIVGVGIGLTVAAAAAGGGLMGAASGAASSADSALAQLKAQYGERPCDRSFSECVDIKSERQRHDTLFKASLGAFGAAGLFAVVTVVYAGVDRPSTKARSAWLVPVFGSCGGGVAFIGTW